MIKINLRGMKNNMEDFDNMAGQSNSFNMIYKLRLEKEINKTDEEKEEEAKVYLTGLICFWCENLIFEDHYYKCKQHKTVFCDNCTHNFYNREIGYTEAPKCKTFKPIDCIFERKDSKKLKGIRIFKKEEYELLKEKEASK